MKNSTMALLIVALIFMGIGFVPQALANGAGEEAGGKIYTVKSSTGEYLGTAQRVLVNALDQADFVVVSLEQGEYGKKQVIVPFSAVSLEGDSLILDLNKEVLAQAPAYTGAEVNDPTYFEGAYRFYGMTPPWTGEEKGTY